MNIAVAGAGVVGVTTAVELKKRFRNANITLISDAFEEDTTSSVAAGIFRPGGDFTGPNRDVTRKWIEDSWWYWKELQESRNGAECGVTELSGYMFSNRSEKVVRNAHLEKLVPMYRSATEEELSNLTPQKWKFGSFYTTLLIDNTIYLPWAMKNFRQLGGEILHEHITNLQRLGSNYDVIVNCTGLGAQTLCNDDALVPVRGQVIKVDAPWIKTFFYADTETYIIPGFKSVTLGGCRELGSYNLDVDKYTALGIRERCENLVPSLKPASTIKTLVGLRPYRKPVRVECEITRSLNGKPVKLVHNYGHGGYGVTAAPGTALHSVQLVREVLSGNSKL
ncbi:unnamed protein product [Phyllotreta striolata]|uniref:FAD dependent oxidoreductase domain-containing protein n=1 Tax=Phyllotreta striolata TaxID=444603 RepID=A0A9N9TK89_PHYSR|nr:unnamed protein product [Phyllotreta striolata]